MQQPTGDGADRDGVVRYPDREGVGVAYIDALVEQNFLSQTASRDDSNLCFVRDWVTKETENGQLFLDEVLRLYIDIRKGRVISDAPLSPEQTRLKLSGLVIVTRERTLRVRNRIYSVVFPVEWAIGLITEKKSTEKAWFDVWGLLIMLFSSATLLIWTIASRSMSNKPRLFFFFFSAIGCAVSTLWIIATVRSIFRRRKSLKEKELKTILMKKECR